MLSIKALSKFKDICKEDYGIIFNDEELEKKALEFLRLFALIYKEPNEDLMEKKYLICNNKKASN